MNVPDWKRIFCACRRQLQKRGINGEELRDRAQDACALVLLRLRRNPQTPLPLAICYAASDAARGRTAHRIVSHGYVDALNPLDSIERARIDRAHRESFDRRCALAQLDLD